MTRWKEGIQTPDVPYPKPKPPTKTEVRVQRARSAAESIAEVVRGFLTGGSKSVSVRRSVLYLIAAGGIGIAMAADTVVPSVIALIAVMLLALTDAVVEL